METSVPRGTLLGNRWRIAGELGEGGFGRVFEAVDESDIGLGRAAVKVLHPNISPSDRNSFLAEVKKIANLRHPNLVGYLDSGQQTIADEIHPYLVTELGVGSLADHLDAKPNRTLTAAETLHILGEVSAGLDHLHQRSLIHRDIKPGNVLYADGTWKLADFGLMRDLTATGTYHRSSQLVGTPTYMAPELFSTNTATAPSDIYALGVLAHLVAAGRPLHSGTGSALVHQITSSPPELDPAMFPGLRELIAWAADPDPANRPTAKQFHEFAVAQQASASTTTRMGGFDSAAHTVPAPGTGTAAPATVPTSPAPSPPHVAHPHTVQQEPSGPVAQPTWAVSPKPPPERGSGGPNWVVPAVIAAAVLGVLAVGAIALNALSGDDSGNNTAGNNTAVSTDGSVSIGGEPGEGDEIDATPEVSAQQVDSSTGESIDLSSPVEISGAIEVALDRQRYPFNASAGDEVSVDVTALNGECETDNRWDMEISIVDPAGEVVGGTARPFSCSTFDPWELTTDGEHALVVAGGQGGGNTATTGSYELTIARLSRQVTEIDLSESVSIEGAIAVARDSQQFSFDASAGDEVSVTIDSLDGQCEIGQAVDIEIFFVDGSGEPVGNGATVFSCEPLGPWQFPADGEYSLVVAGRSGGLNRPPTGTFELTVIPLPLESTEIDLSSPVALSGGIAVPLDRQMFAFDGTAGQRLSVEVIQMNGECDFFNSFALDVYVVDASGELVGDDATNVHCGDALGPWELPADGEYAVVAAGQPGFAGTATTGTYEMRVASLQG